jgi:hypothetical protein
MNKMKYHQNTARQYYKEEYPPVTIDVSGFTVCL